MIAHDDNVGPFVQYDIDKDGYITLLRDYLSKKPPTTKDERWVVTAAIAALHHSVMTYPSIRIHTMMDSYDRALSALSYDLLASYAGESCEIFFPPQWTQKIWDIGNYKQVLVDYMCGDIQAQKKLDLSVEAKNMASPRYCRNVQACNLPKHIIVLHARKEIEHDVIMSLDMSSNTESSVHMIPFSLDAENHLNGLAEFVRNYPSKNDEFIAPILRCILSSFKEE